MENMFNASLPITDHSHMGLDAATSHLLSSSFIQSGIPDHISCRQTVASGSNFPTMHEETLNDLYIANDGDTVSEEVPISRIMPHIRNVSINGSSGNSSFPEHFTGTSMPSFTNLLSSTTSLHESLISFGIAPSSALPSDELRTSRSNGSCTTLNSPVHCDFGMHASKKDGNLNQHLNSGWNYGEAPGDQIPSARTTSTVRPSYHIFGSSEVGWISNKSTLNYDSQYGYFAPSNELSLSLGSSQPSIINFSNVPDQCSEVSCSGITQDASALQDHSHGMRHSLCDLRLEKRLELGHYSANNDELLLQRDSSTGFRFPRVMMEPKFLHATHEILSEIASYALEDLDGIDDPLGEAEDEGKFSSSSICINARGLSVLGSGMFPVSSGEMKSIGYMDPPLQQHETDMKKSELLMMLQEVERQCKQYIDQIQNVISAFHGRFELGGPQMNIRFALQTVSAYYKNLRRRITGQIVSGGQQPDNESVREKERSFETSFIQRQWALQQLKKNDHQSWRPQRGLPERSVSVLRAWMFQNFLHPYPKDNEKQLLAIRSGLTRSQVSNWFINARVRLWKPMIEEMYAEINKRSRTEEGYTSESRNHGDIGYQGIQMN